MTVIIKGMHQYSEAFNWCWANLGERRSNWDVELLKTGRLSMNREFTYTFTFKSESDAVWFALVHAEAIQ